MMTEVAVRVENLSKQYRIGKPERYRTLRDTLTDAMYAPFRRIRSAFQPSSLPASQHPNGDDTIWALKDVSFEIKQGEVVGIIGRNGAGKSTLLKILSRITEPTEGTAEIHGRVGSLLEVGTGFHPELTGRENIYLNGAILGMRKAEIGRKFDEIVAFAEVEKFIDTPVKHYSSGMYLRLAFAVAAHLEPDIMLVDEVLAVGDAAFQKKCLGKMNDVAWEGRTVLFVSHQMAAVQNLCPRAIMFNHGKVEADGVTEAVIEKYLRESAKMVAISIAERKDRKGTGDIRFKSMVLRNSKREDVTLLHSGQDAIFMFTFENHIRQDLRHLQLAVGIDNIMGQRITLLSNELTSGELPIVPSHVKSIGVYVKHLPLVPGRYGFTIYAAVNGVTADWIQNAGFFDVEAGDYYNTGKLPPATQGDFLVDHHVHIGEIE